MRTTIQCEPHSSHRSSAPSTDNQSTGTNTESEPLNQIFPVHSSWHWSRHLVHNLRSLLRKPKQNPRLGQHLNPNSRKLSFPRIRLMMRKTNLTPSKLRKSRSLLLKLRESRARRPPRLQKGQLLRPPRLRHGIRVGLG